MSARRQFRGQQSTTIVVALNMEPLTGSAVGGGCSENRLVVRLEELVTARSVRERYLVSLHHATTVSIRNHLVGNVFQFLHVHRLPCRQ